MRKPFYTIGILICTICSMTAWTQSKEHPGPLIYEIPLLSDWSEALRIKAFYGAEQNGATVIEGEILAAFDGENLVIRADLPAFENEREPVKCYLSDEPDLRELPHLAISLDPGHTHGIYYRYLMDSKGRKQELKVDDESWNAAWSVASITGNGRFTAEIKIPVQQISSPDLEGTFWGFDVALPAAEKGKVFHSTPMGLRTADAANFGHILFKGKLDKNQVEDLKASLPGIHQGDLEKKLAANNALCGPGLAELPGELKGMAAGVDFRLQDGTKMTCLGIDNPPVIRSGYPFFYEKFENPDLQRLRNQYNLEEIIAPGKNDFEQILLLNEWLVNHVTFGSPPPIRPQALQVLYYGLNGETFYCTYLSFTLMQMFCSLGFTARKLTSVGHGTLDVWSNYWGKWMQIDPSRNSYFRLAGSAIPLNSNEIRREFHRNKGVDMEMVFGTGQRAERVTLERRDTDGAYRYRQDGYEWVAYKSRNNFFEIPFAYWNFDYLIAEDEYSRNKIWQHNGETDVRQKLGIKTSRTGDLFWTLNQAFIHLYDKGSSLLKVQLETHTPNFESFEVAMDHGEWQKTDPVFSWQLHGGQNFLMARSLNKFGVYGPVHKIVFQVNDHPSDPNQ
jgi:hypothetical protein